MKNAHVHVFAIKKKRKITTGYKMDLFKRKKHFIYQLNRLNQHRALRQRAHNV